MNASEIDTPAGPDANSRPDERRDRCVEKDWRIGRRSIGVPKGQPRTEHEGEGQNDQFGR